ncbi:MAG: pyruvate ferredoxin oxidoreductase [Syntrophales bacterium]|jgi:pyruvate/2-oxoacid:ferredoxin oxidoreductase alpha subunit|nr:pyruvate ferredoxin oxidoreductase [Syntrophales bacterium]
MKILLQGNYAVAEAVHLARVQFVAAYPITPQTPIYERLSDMELEGRLAGVMMRTESEHSAMAACISASLTGVRTFTATASQGIALMHEMLHFASGNRVPIVMCNVNRVIAIPWAFGSDQSDSLSQRDTGWLQLYCEDAQEAVDTVIQAYKIAEQALFPVMVCIDGFFTSHFLEPLELPEQDAVDRFLPPFSIPTRLDTNNPAFIGNVVSPEQYMVFRQRSFEDMEKTKPLIKAVDREYREIVGRGYDMVEAVNTDGAEIVLATSGAMTSTARVAIESLRAKGYKAGLLKMKAFRPFPTQEVQEILKNVPKIAVLDRNISIGKEGIWCQELKAALYPLAHHPLINGYIAGICGADVSPDMIEDIVIDTLNKEKANDLPTWVRRD